MPAPLQNSVPSILSRPSHSKKEVFASPAVAKTSRARNQNSSIDDSRSFLTLYFREMSDLDVLTADKELETAQTIESLDIAVWVRLLALPQVVAHVTSRIQSSLQEPPSFRGIRRAATVACRNPTKENREKLARAVRRIGVKLRDSDKDRLVVLECAEHLQGLRRKAVRNKEFECSTTSFSSYLRGLESASRAAQAARNEFVKANLRLVVSIARRFNHGRMALADLIQEGNIGLIKAVERFDYRRGFRFSTYASWWIRHSVSRALADKGREVRLPVHMIDAHHRVAKARRELSATLSRPPTSEEIAEATEISLSKIERMRSYLLDGSLSLDKPMNDEDGRTLAEVLEDPAAVSDEIVDKISAAKNSQRLHHLLGNLKPIEAEILRYRFGFDDDHEYTLKEIGVRYNLSRERIRQLQEQALQKMRRAMAEQEQGVPAVAV